jgi:hypothetical protein
MLFASRPDLLSIQVGKLEAGDPNPPQLAISTTLIAADATSVRNDANDTSPNECLLAWK